MKLMKILRLTKHMMTEYSIFIFIKEEYKMKKIHYTLILLTLITGCNISNKNQSYTKMPKDVIPIQAHRGGGLAEPENTLETFNKSWEMKIIPEADIRTSKDSIIVCIHDDTPSRLAPGSPDSLINKSFGDMMLKQIKGLDVGEFRGKPGQHIPTLEEVFKQMEGKPNRLIYLDYKKISIPRLAGMVKKYHIERQVIFTSNNQGLICEWKVNIPQAPTLIWMGGTQEELGKKLDILRNTGFKGITTLQIHVKIINDSGEQVYSPSLNFLAELAKELKNKGILFQTLPWEVNDPAVYTKLLEVGVESFATDYPEISLKAFMEYKGLKNQHSK